jgi:predicted ester cyclase
MTVEENTALVRRAVDAFNRDDYVDHGPSRAALPPGPEGVRQAWHMMRSAFPDLQATLDDLVAEGDKVAVRGHIDGTHDGEVMGIPPTGKRVTGGSCSSKEATTSWSSAIWGSIPPCMHRLFVELFRPRMHGNGCAHAPNAACRRSVTSA